MAGVFLLLICGLKFKGGGTNEWFGVRECNFLRGTAAIYVMLSHIQVDTPFDAFYAWPLYVPKNSTILTNGLFFFISGYGLWESRKHKKDYLSYFSYISRCIRLCVPAYLAYVVYYFVKLIMGDTKDSLLMHLCLGKLFSWFYFNGAVWFIIVLFFLYFLFWLVYRSLPPMAGNIVLFIMISVWTVIAVSWGRGLVWYASTFCFLLGIVLSQYRERISFSKIYLQIILIGLLLFAAVYSLFMQTAEGLGLTNAVFANVSALLFCILCYIAMYHISLGNRMGNWVGKFSYELYLVHTMVMKAVNAVCVQEVFRIYGAVLLSLAVAYVMYLADVRISCGLDQFLLRVQKVICGTREYKSK